MIIISVGSNLSGAWADTPYQMCQEAVERLSALLDCRSIIVSNWYKTSPIPISSQPFYINGVVAFEKDISGMDLLSLLNALEGDAGRIRKEINEARPLDLDIIAIDNQKICYDEKLVVPHPRAHLRGFVLYPLRDVLPSWIHPETNETVDELIEHLSPDQIIEIYDPSV